MLNISSGFFFSFKRTQKQAGSRLDLGFTERSARLTLQQPLINRRRKEAFKDPLVKTPA